jgi:hypothetical protein
MSQDRILITIGKRRYSMTGRHTDRALVYFTVLAVIDRLWPLLVMAAAIAGGASFHDPIWAFVRSLLE